MPALYSQYGQYVRSEMRAVRDRAMKNEAKGEPGKNQLDVLDPVCAKPITLGMLTRLDSKAVDAYLETWNKTAEKGEEEDAKEIAKDKDKNKSRE